MNITASQIRQDFSCFGEFGQQGYGYNVEELRAEIGHILGVDKDHRLIMIGVGNLGRALLQNFPFSQIGFVVDAAFDVNPSVIGSVINEKPVRHIDEMQEFIRANSVSMGIIAVPAPFAQDVCDRMVASGIRGILCFAPVHLSVPPDVAVRHEDFAVSLALLAAMMEEKA